MNIGFSSTVLNKSRLLLPRFRLHRQGHLRAHERVFSCHVFHYQLKVCHHTVDCVQLSIGELVEETIFALFNVVIFGGHVRLFGDLESVLEVEPASVVDVRHRHQDLAVFTRLGQLLGLVFFVTPLNGLFLLLN